MMKKFRFKSNVFVSLVLAMVMCMSLMVPALAAEATAGYTYDVFQIFTGDYAAPDIDSPGAGDLAGKALSNVKWGTNGTGETGTDVPQSVLDDLAALVDQDTGDGQEWAADGSNVTKLDTILKYVDLDGTPVVSGVSLEEVNDLDVSNGYYLVRVNAGSVQDGEAFDIYTVQVVDRRLNLQPKYEGEGNVPDIEKKIFSDVGPVSKDDAAIGDTVTFVVFGHLPTNLHDYKEYFWLLEDTLSDGLTWDGRLSVRMVELNGKDVLSQMYVSDEKDGDNKIYMGFQNVKALGSDLDGAEIVIRYEAVVNDAAVIASELNSNDAVLQYSHNPNKSGDGTKKNDPHNPPVPDVPTGKTIEGEHTHTETWITGLTVEHFNKRGTPMTGAEFELTGNNLNTVIKYTSRFDADASGNYYKLKNGGYTNVAPEEATEDQYDLTAGMFVRRDVLETKNQGVEAVTATIDTNGQLTITGLKSGDYVLKNTRIPAGYNLADDIEFTISFNEEDLFSSDNEQVQERTPEWFYVTIIADNGALLPETGGAGIAMFIVIGLCVFAAAGFGMMVWFKKRNTSVN